MKRKNIIDDDRTYRVIGCAMNVHSELGTGFQEKIYHKALICEFLEKEIPFTSEIEKSIYYRGNYLGKRSVDFIVFNSVMLEIKAIKALEDVHLNQGLNYLKAYQLELGLLINFGQKSLEVKRLFLPV